VLFKEVNTVYSENHVKHLSTLCGQNARLIIVSAGGKCSYCCGLKASLMKTGHIIVIIV
jgi:hypothetical protein